jgi:ribosomal protein S3
MCQFQSISINSLCKIVLSEIGYYYLELNKWNKEKTKKTLDNLKITNISINNKNISIKLARPGLLIGLHGKNIDNLNLYIKNCGYDLKITSIIEDIEIDSLYNCILY